MKVQPTLVVAQYDDTDDVTDQSHETDHRHCHPLQPEGVGHFRLLDIDPDNIQKMTDGRLSEA